MELHKGLTRSDLTCARSAGSAGSATAESLFTDFNPTTTRLVCEACGGSDFWRSVYGNSHCRVCCPPLDPSQVADSKPAIRTRLDSAPAGLPSVDDDVAPVARLEPVPRGIDWPDAVKALAWPEGFVPDWVTHRVEVQHERRQSGRESHLALVSWIRPSWIEFPDSAWPMPTGRRWAPNDLAACWFCGFTLFWKDMHGDEVCGICSPPLTSGHVAGWFLKPGPALVV